jgi:hypothetical protein
LTVVDFNGTNANINEARNVRKEDFIYRISVT